MQILRKTIKKKYIYRSKYGILKKIQIGNNIFAKKMKLISLQKIIIYVYINNFDQIKKNNIINFWILIFIKKLGFRESMEIEAKDLTSQKEFVIPLISCPKKNNIFSPEEISALTRRISSFSIRDIEGKLSTLMTSLVIFNNMIGITIMVLPLLFLKCGLFTSICVMFIICFVNFLTCKLCVDHFKRNESDLPEIIERILGNKFKVFFVIGSVTMFFSGGVVYLILMNNMLYPIIIFIFDHIGFDNYAKKSEFRFDIYSYQINSLILMIPCFMSCFFKKIDFVASLSKIGVYVLLSYIIFLIYIFIENSYNGNLSEKKDKVPFWTLNITEISGACAMAFFAHIVICPLIKSQKNKEEYDKSLFMGYSFSFIFYIFVGVIGCFGIVGRLLTDENPQTIMDFFEKDSAIPFIIEVMYFLKLVTVYPVFCFISKVQFLSLFPKQNLENEQNFNLLAFIYNLMYIFIGEMSVIFNFDLTFVIGFSAAVFGFFLNFFIPIFFHLKCYSNQSKTTYTELNSYIEEKECNHHDDQHLFSLSLRSLFYLGFVMPIGIYLMTIQLIALFNLDWM